MSESFIINFFTSSEFYIFNVDIDFPYIYYVSLLIRQAYNMKSLIDKSAIYFRNSSKL